MRALSRFAVCCLAGFLSTTAWAQTGAPKCPNILVVFDVSFSMNDPVPGAGQNRYQVARDAVNGLVLAGADQFRYGLELFGLAGNSGCEVSSPLCSYPSAPTCRSVTSDFRTAQAIGSVLDAGGPTGSTPTALAMTTAIQRPDMQDLTRPRFALLVTDGEPTCGNGGDPLVQSVNGVLTARDAGVRTFVLGFAGGSPSNLAQMAVAGGVPKTGCDAGTPQSCYYNATNAAELQTALNAIQQVVTTELGSAGGCDETCYATGCSTAGQICKQTACVADPCASVTCGSGEACVEGTCRKFCTTACATGQFCDNGTCKEEVPCPGGCNGRNQVCVGGACVENYCTGATYNLAAKCPAGTTCNRNGCAPPPLITLPDGGTLLPDGGTPNNTTTGPGCCSGAPEAFSLVALAFGLLALAARGRRRAEG